ncbi:hypothetical protein [Streptomyces sp. NRRL S-118]|uniref:hypothetical protein n=1 Tax=Streptomyces sp. NRRL S-118 TaxID=1463881 RepID=UPI00131DAF4B|nr:hypothetical protein [Streptomyces sp. NRRL S-118]
MVVEVVEVDTDGLDGQARLLGDLSVLAHRVGAAEQGVVRACTASAAEIHW